MPQNPYCCDEDSVERSYLGGQVLLVDDCTTSLVPDT
jgi:hypothetical protein